MKTLQKNFTHKDLSFQSPRNTQIKDYFNSFNPEVSPSHNILFSSKYSKESLNTDKNFQIESNLRTLSSKSQHKIFIGEQKNYNIKNQMPVSLLQTNNFMNQMNDGKKQSKLNINENFPASKISPTTKSSTDSLNQSKNVSNNLDYLDNYFLKLQNGNLKTENQKLKQTIKKLRNQLGDKVDILNKFNILMKDKYKEIKQLKSDNQNKTQIIKNLQKSQIKLKNQVFKRSKQLDQLKMKEKGTESTSAPKIDKFQLKIRQLREQLQEEKNKNMVAFLKISELKTVIKQLQEKNQEFDYNKSMQKLEQSLNLNSMNVMPQKLQQSESIVSAFDQALRLQINQINQLKQFIECSQEKNQKLSENLTSSRKQLEQLRAEMKVWQVKSTSERNKIIAEHQLQCNEKDNQLENITKKFKTLQEKYRTCLNEIRQKDEFFKQYLLGRTNNQPTTNELIVETLKKYTQNREDLIELRSENDSLKDKLERFKMYETVSEQQNENNEL